MQSNAIWCHSLMHELRYFLLFQIKVNMLSVTVSISLQHFHTCIQRIRKRYIVQVNRACRSVGEPVDYNVQCYNEGKWRGKWKYTRQRVLVIGWL